MGRALRRWAGAVAVLLILSLVLVGCAALREAQERRAAAEEKVVVKEEVVQEKEVEVVAAEASGVSEAELLKLKTELAVAEKERDQAKEERDEAKEDVAEAKAEVKEEALSWLTFIGPALLGLAGIRLPVKGGASA